MPVDLHFICRQGLNHTNLGNQQWESGDWAVADATANRALGGRIYLHEKQSEPAWHGGSILEWRASPQPGRKIFGYVVDGSFRIRCPGNWSQETAIVEHNEN